MSTKELNRYKKQIEALEAKLIEQKNLEAALREIIRELIEELGKHKVVTRTEYKPNDYTTPFNFPPYKPIKPTLNPEKTPKSPYEIYCENFPSKEIPTGDSLVC